MSKQFPTLDVLGAITGRLMADIGGIYEVCNHATGEPVFKHQLPRICREVKAAILERSPHLQQAIDESEQITKENFRGWGEKWLARYGETMSVPTLSAAEHESIGPISDIVEMVHPSRIVIATVDD